MTCTFLGFSREYKVYGPQGGLAMEVTLPDGLNEDTDKCPIPALAKALAEEGIASICFDFGGHWKSEGKMQYMTVGKDTIVPMSCSDKFVETYTQDAELIVVEGDNHMFTKRLRTVVSHAVSFFASQLK